MGISSRAVQSKDSSLEFSLNLSDFVRSHRTEVLTAEEFNVFAEAYDGLGKTDSGRTFFDIYRSSGSLIFEMGSLYNPVQANENNGGAWMENRRLHNFALIERMWLPYVHTLYAKLMSKDRQVGLYLCINGSNRFSTCDEHVFLSMDYCASMRDTGNGRNPFMNVK